jgi:DNA (cytosine-5)-methyltransferase 1
MEMSVQSNKVPTMSFKFVDLFAGIGGFHAALASLGGTCVYASEIDKDASEIYLRNWGRRPKGDITQLANDDVMDVPPHDVLVGGFPCQPFSKSGLQKGMEEVRGTLFWNIARIIEVHQPTLVLLENVRNLAGPRHIHEWNVIIHTLRELGYRVSDDPLIVSPHQIHPNFGGRPQVRERVFIAATKIPVGSSKFNSSPVVPDLSKVMKDWMPQDWNLAKHLPLEKLTTQSKKAEVALNESEIRWIDAWDDFVVTMRKKLKDETLPGFPIWVDEWVHIDELVIPYGTPDWKATFLRKNSEFYTKHQKTLDAWMKRIKIKEENLFPPSRRKLEWQAQETKTLKETIMHFRPSGIRAKKPTYVPALVAITQTSIIGKQGRRLTVREAARLQGLPDWFDFVGQNNSASYKQLGNGVNVGVVYNVLKAQVLRDVDLLAGKPALLRSVIDSPDNPDEVLHDYSKVHHGGSEDAIFEVSAATKPKTAVTKNSKLA